MVIKRKPEILQKNEKEFEVIEKGQSFEDFFNQNFFTSIDFLRPTPWFRNSYKGDVLILLYNGHRDLQFNQFNNTVVSLFGFLEDVQSHMKSQHNMSLPLRIAFRDEYLYMAHRLGVDMNWMDLHPSFAVTIMNKHGNFYPLTSHKNVTVSEANPLKVADWVVEYEGGNISECLKSQSLDMTRRYMREMVKGHGEEPAIVKMLEESQG